jgi:hypothetical protein
MKSLSADNFRYSEFFLNINAGKAPAFIVYTEGDLSPRIPDETYSMPEAVTVADFNNDGLDDVILTYGDTYTKPRIYLSNGDGTLSFWDVMPEDSARRHIRNTSVEDLNGDGFLDYVGYAAPHGFYEETLGPLWDYTEPDLILLNNKGTGFITVPNLIEASHHGGSTGDINHDGLVDVFGMSEVPNREGGRSALLQNTNGEFIKSNWNLDAIFPNRMISDIRIKDLNNDGLDDFVLTLAPLLQGNGGPIGTPMASSEVGAFAYAFGKRGVDPSQLDWNVVGQHWMTESEWNLYLQKNDQNSSSNKSYASGPSNIEVLDVNQDGLDDVLVGFYVSAPFRWETSGFRYFQNTGSSFVDKTTQLFPNQDAARNVQSPTSFILGFTLVDLDGDADKDLVVTSKENEKSNERPNDFSTSFYINNGEFFEPPLRGQVDYALEGKNGFSGLRIGDFNGDGAPDTLTLRQGGAQVGSTWKNDDEFTLIVGLNKLAMATSSSQWVGTAGSDTIDFKTNSLAFARGGGGNDLLIGRGDESVTALFWGGYADYTISEGSGGFRVEAKASNEGLDTLVDLYRIRFADSDLALDTDGATSAGGIYRLYKATFNREPDTGGLGYWIAQADAGSKDAVRMAEDFTWSEEFQSLYGITTTDNYGTGTDVSELVTGFYENVLGRSPDAGGLNYYTGVIESHQKTVGRVLAEISDSPENYDGTIALIANGIVFDPWVG